MIFLVGLAIILALLMMPVVLKNPKNIDRLTTDRSLRRLDTQTRDIINQQLLMVQTLKKGGTPSQLKQAVLELDKCLCLVLTSVSPEKGFPQQMKSIRKFFPDMEEYNALWFGHKVRNIIAHEVNQDLPSAQLMKIVQNYQRALDTFLREL